jgi:Mg/Co/Ni transporter MgtE
MPVVAGMAGNTGAGATVVARGIAQRDRFSSGLRRRAVLVWS